MAAALDLARDMARPAVRSMLLGSTALTRFGVNGVEAALALDFIGGEYRTANTATTFADAFTGTSPKLTYSTAAGSNSTMVNSAGNIVWAPHNLVTYSEASQTNWPAYGASTVTDLSEDALGVFPGVSVASGGQTWHASSPASMTLTASQVYSLTVWYAAGTSNELYVAVKDVTTGDEVRAKGAIGSLATSGLGGSMSILSDEEIGGGVRRLSVTVTLNNTGDHALIVGPNSATSGETVKIYGAHVYRSDLGGMAQVPGAATGFEYYVPTNGNPEYLPRVGHHVYNGSAWVNEGLLIESEARTNLVTYSEDVSSWSLALGVDRSQTNQTAAPSGEVVADLVAELEGIGGNHIIADGASFTAGVTYTQSVFLKKGSGATAPDIMQLTFGSAAFGTSQYANYNIATGEVLTSTGGTALIEYFGNGWYRCAFTSTASTTVSTSAGLIFTNNNDALGRVPSYTGVATSDVFVYGLQIEQGQVVNGTPVDAPTPSSYMPTSGGTYTRTAQSLEVPPAQFGWPEPEYIGSELLSAFSNASWTTTTGEWTYDAANDEWDLALSAAGSTSALSHDITVTEGSVYIATATVSNVTNVTGNELFIRINNTEAGTIDLLKNDGSGAAITQGGDGTYTVTFVAGASTPDFQIRAGGASDGDETVTLVSASVREINPLAVSIQMDGRMTYADEDEWNTVLPYLWRIDSPNKIDVAISTYTTDTGGAYFRQSESNIYDEVNSNNTYSPGINVPFNISSRHGSTFINGAVDGVALTADTTPTALPDLSGTNLQIAYDFMGTIGTFRQFAGDIGDTGLVTATNPSTEPTLSLTFNGTAGGSFYNLSWSE